MGAIVLLLLLLLLCRTRWPACCPPHPASHGLASKPAAAADSRPLCVADTGEVLKTSGSTVCFVHSGVEDATPEDWDFDLEKVSVLLEAGVLGHDRTHSIEGTHSDTF